MPTTLGTSIVSHAAAIALGAIAAAVLLNAHLTEPQSLADYIAAICARTFHAASAHPASAVEASFLADNVSAMTKMMINMGIRPSGDVDTDFVAAASSGRHRDGAGGAALWTQ
jgi:hypothetical protein